MTIETRFDTFDQKLDRIAATVEINNGQIARLTEQMIMTDLKIDRMADKVDHMADKVDRMAEKVARVADAVEQQSKALIAQAQTLLQQAEASKLQAENFSRLLTQLEQRQTGNA
ncbi:MAG: hypothetical protein LH647_08790 [Leptolyngbyaceae cyanobacterium CAN_BIN12]|nr:hypothetical protein [Leptolyngbyaceae cyanobacterium CAN_BIN12]